MERSPDRLAWLALLIVDEAAQAAERGEVVPRTLALRFALAYLCSIADGPFATGGTRRSVFDDFWQLVTTEATGSTPHMSTYSKSSYVRTHLAGMDRQLQLHPGPLDIREWCSPEARSRRAVAEALTRSDDDRARAKWRKRQGYFGRPYPDDER